MSSAPVRVLVADDRAPFLRAARALIERTDGFELIGEASSGEEAVLLAASLRPNLILMDVTMPGIGGIEATRRIVSHNPAIVAVLVSTYSEAELPGDARSCGAAAYIHKDGLGPDTLTDLWRRRSAARQGRAAPP